jgi:hypothetical protein
MRAPTLGGEGRAGLLAAYRLVGGTSREPGGVEVERVARPTAPRRTAARRDAHDGRHLAADNRADTHADRPPQRRNRTASHDEQARMIRRYIAWRVDAGTADSRRARTGEPARGDHVVDRDPRGHPVARRPGPRPTQCRGGRRRPDTSRCTAGHQCIALRSGGNPRCLFNWSRLSVTVWEGIGLRVGDSKVIGQPAKKS